MSLPCLILAAGFGTRMGDLVNERPKPLLEVAGKALLDHALAPARQAGCAPIAVNGHYLADQIHAHIANRNVMFLHETPRILDSGGSVKNAARRLPAGPMVTLNSDNVWSGPNPVGALMEAFDPHKMSALLLLTPRAAAIGRKGPGDFSMDPEGRLALNKVDTSFVYTGAQILDPTPALNDQRDVFSLRDIWADYQRKGRLFGLVYSGSWADVGHPDGLTLAEEMLSRHV